MILGGLRDKNFKFRCVYVPIKLDILPVTRHDSHSSTSKHISHFLKNITHDESECCVIVNLTIVLFGR